MSEFRASFKVGLPLFIVAINLRAGLVSINPILSVIGRDLHLSTLSLSWLAAIPLICFGVAAPFSVYARRVGNTNQIIGYALWVLGISLLLRGTGSILALYIFTLFMGISITMLNISFPVWIKEHASSHAGIATGTYVAMQGIFAAAAIAIAAPLSKLTSYSWRLSIIPWGVVALVTAIWWHWQTRSQSDSQKISTEFLKLDLSLLKSARAWQISLFFGVQSALFYASGTWYPTILVDRGLSLNSAGYFVSISGIIGSFMGIIVPLMSRKYHDLRLIIVGVAFIIGSGFLGILFDSGPRLMIWVSMTNIGFSTSFSLALYMFIIRSRDASATHSLSIMAQCIGYLIAAIAPIIMGVLFVATGNWNSGLWFLIGLTGLLAGLGIKAGKPGSI